MRHDKENTLSFQNITQTMKVKKSRKDCCYHHLDKQAKYRDRQSNLFYCKSCAVQQASRGCPIEDLQQQPASSSCTTLQQIYEKGQYQLQQQIRTYNSNFQQLMELLTDMQIRDLLTFNMKLEQNRAAYERMKQKANHQWDRHQLRELFASEESQAVLDKMNGLIQQIQGCKANGRKSGTFQGKYSCNMSAKNQSQRRDLKGSKMNASNVSLQQPIVASNEGSSQSFGKSHNTNSYKSKNSTVEQIKQSVYEDTPESVKLKTSNNNELKVTSDMAVTMFEKIDVCESISLSQQSRASVAESKSESGQGRSSFNSLKSRYRYSRNEQNQR